MLGLLGVSGKFVQVHDLLSDAKFEARDLSVQFLDVLLQKAMC